MTDHRWHAPDQENITVIEGLVAAAGAGLDPTEIRQVIAVVTTRPNARTRLRNSLERIPDPLTSGTPFAPRQVQRFLRALIDAGAEGVRLPACQRCSSSRPVEHTLADGRRVCGPCHRAALARPCEKCGEARYCANRLDGALVCQHCYQNDPRNKAECASCGRLGHRVVRTPDGVLCERCAPRRQHTCFRCGRSRPATAILMRGPICDSCYKALLNTAMPCPRCAQLRILAYLDDSGTDVCASCAGQPPKFACGTCGSEEHLVGRRCARCVLTDRATALLSDQPGGIRAELRPVLSFLLTRDDPRTTLSWISRSKGTSILRGMAQGETAVSHDGIDTFPPTRPREYIRDLLVSSSVLAPVPRELRNTLEWIDRFLSDLAGPDRHTLLTYTRWTVVRRLRTRSERGRLTESVARNTRAHLRALGDFLSWLHAHGTSLGDARQAHIDAFLVARPIGIRHLPQFLGWAHTTGHCGPLTAPTRRSELRTPQAADREHWENIERLLHDEKIRVDTRICGLFVLLYGQNLSRLCRMTLDLVEATDEHVSVRFATDPITLPPGVDDLLRRHLQILNEGEQEHGGWLFPGRNPARPIVHGGLGVRLKQIGIQPQTVRTTAIMQLAAGLPAAVLAGFLGIHPQTAVTWNKIAAGDWNSYPALRKRQQAGTNNAPNE